MDTNREMARWTKVVGVFTAVLAVINILTLAAVGWQSYTAWQAANDVRLQARAAIQVTGFQAIIAPDRDTAEIKTGFMPSFQNFGGARAIAVKGWQSIAYFDGGVPNILIFLARSRPWKIAVSAYWVPGAAWGSYRSAFRVAPTI